MLPNVRQSTTVFLTVGLVRIGGGGTLDSVAVRALGLEALSIPPAIGGALHDVALSYLLTKSYDYGINLFEAVEAVSAGNARYLGARLIPGEEQEE